MKYEILGLFGDNWVKVMDEASKYGDPTGFVALVKSIRDETGGKIKEVGRNEMRYKITNDPLKLVFQGDSLFGIVIIAKKRSDFKRVKNLLERHFRKLEQLSELDDIV